ncbi:MAG: MBL fold metallo-hydrolase [Sphingobacterium sp.]
MIRYCALASGSNGNSYFIAKDDTAILVDAGINCKQLQLRMQEREIDPSSIRAVFITHEHVDHVKGLSVFVKRHKIPVYLTSGTYTALRTELPADLLNFIPVNAHIQLGALSIFGVPKYHDASEPCSFFISDGRLNIAVLTDIGRICENVKKTIAQSDVLFLEANYDEELLRCGRYPIYLKNRIRGGWGHLSNTSALDAFLTHKSSRLKHLILGHLSAENNTEELVYSLFEPHCRQQVRLSIARRTEPTPLFELSNTPTAVQTELFSSVLQQDNRKDLG